MANILTIEKLTKSYTERRLFDGISLGISDTDRIGVIGINGTGKSTLLKIVAGEETAEEGTITRKNGLRVSYLPQNPVFDPEKTLLQNVTEGLSAKESYRNLPGEAAAMLAKLGLPDASVSPAQLSGGQRKRAALVRALLTESELLILDEPTNHLDSEMTEWLEEYLRKWKGAFLMVTHDRYFLDRVANKIVELDKGKLYSYQTNYSGFLERKAEREELLLAAEQKAKNLYRIELAWMQRGARARSTKQKAHIARFEALENRERPVEDASVEINALSSRMGKKTVELKELGKSYGGKPLFSHFSYLLLPQDRIGIVGRNGCGKSTLMNLLAGRLLPDEGEIEVGATVKIGYFSQENEEMDLSKTVLEYIRDTAEFVETRDGRMTASAMCEQLLFDKSMQYTRIEKLSGGERRRLYLLKVLMEAPNVLLLDEPTNDLDIKTLTILENYLSEYEGIVIAVSHDRYFLDRFANRIFAFEENGTIARYEGNYSDYREARAVRAANRETANGTKEPEKKAEPSRGGFRQREERLRFSYQEQKEYETIDAEIATWELRLAELEEEIAGCASEYARLTALFEEKEQAKQKLEERMDRWVYLNDLAERIAKGEKKGV